MKNISIIGGGPAALMLAAQLSAEKFRVTLHENKKTLGRKFLVAGEGGLNLTFNSSIDELINQYVPNKFMDPILRTFSNEDLINWLHNLEIPTFIGSSKRVFPDKNLKPIEVLNKIIDNVSSKNITFDLGNRWIGWTKDGHLRFEQSEDIEADIVVFALGGASWKVTGSDGEWSKLFEDSGISVKKFRAANCAFGVNWNTNFIRTHEGKPLKNIAVKYQDQYSKGELVISKFGLEGNAIYALSQKIQDSLLTEDQVKIELDLKPTLTIDQLKTKFKSSKRSKVTDLLKSDLNLDRTAIGLLKQFSDKETFLNPDLLVKTIKAVPILIHSSDDIDKAISTLGGIDLNEIDENFQIKKMPNSYAIGEMLDWYAPTGGYLLQACFSMGKRLGTILNNEN